MKADHATWETGLVIPEAYVDPVLATLLRCEELLASIERRLGTKQPEAIIRAQGIVSQQRAGTMEEGDVSGLVDKPKGKRKQ
jgi:hypothetical protein